MNTLEQLKAACKTLNINSELTLEEIEEIAYNTNIVDYSRLQQVTNLLDVIQVLKEVKKLIAFETINLNSFLPLIP